MISVENVRKSYGKLVALDGLSFAAPSGQIIGIVGPNGAGKSSCLRLLAGLGYADEGSIRLNGIEAQEDPQRYRKMVGYMPEDVPLYEEMRVHELLAHRAGLKGLRRRERAEELRRVLALCDAADVERRIVGQLSKGYRQRVGLAEALLGAPPLLVLDEPTSGLDPNQLRGIRQLLEGLRGRHTVVVSSHILSEVQASCDRILLVAQGKLLADATPQDLCRVSGGLTIELRAPEGDLREALGEFPGIAALSCSANKNEAALRCHLTLAAETDADALAERIAAMICARGWPLRRLELSRGDVAEAFWRLTKSNRGAA